MRNISILMLLALATFGAWVLFSARVLSPLLEPGAPHKLYFGLFTFDDFLGLLLFSGWAFLVARLAHSLFSGPTASRYRMAIVGLTLLFFVYTNDMLISINFSPWFAGRGLLMIAVVAGCAWLGLHQGPFRHTQPLSEVSRAKDSE